MYTKDNYTILWTHERCTTCTRVFRCIFRKSGECKSYIDVNPNTKLSLHSSNNRATLTQFAFKRTDNVNTTLFRDPANNIIDSNISHDTIVTANEEETHSVRSRIRWSSSLWAQRNAEGCLQSVQKSRKQHGVQFGFRQMCSLDFK